MDLCSQIPARPLYAKPILVGNRKAMRWIPDRWIPLLTQKTVEWKLAQRLLPGPPECLAPPSQELSEGATLPGVSDVELSQIYRFIKHLATVLSSNAS